MPNWNPQQLEAIQTVDHNIIVSASAGAGKTTVLVQRLLKRILTDQIQVNEILAMTFTEAAAMEMKKRLMKEMQTRIEQCTQPEQLAYLNKQLALLPSADVCTIDAFCLKLLKNYSYVLGMDPQRFQKIYDRNTLSLFQAQAMEQALQHQYEQQQPAFLTLLETLSSSNDQHQKLKDYILALAKEASKKNNAYQWLDNCIRYYQPVNHLNELPCELQEYIWEFYLRDVHYLKSILNDFQKFIFIQTGGNPLFDQFYERVNHYLSTMEQHLNHKDYTSFKQEMEQAFATIKCPDCRKVTGQPMKDLPQYKDYRDQILNKIKTYVLEELESEKAIVDALANQHDMVAILIQAAKDYLRAFQALKTEHGGIDFEDMERYAIQLLYKNDKEIAQVLQQQYAEIMVDEYQDSNDIQESLIQAICRYNNVFRVGDIKQSIYSFRNAKPDLMRSLINNATQYDKIIYLSNNYRSKYNIVEFNNVLFEQLMNIQGFHDQYQAQDRVEVGLDSQKSDDFIIDLDILCKKPLKESGMNLSSNEMKARYIAYKILEMKEHSTFHNWKDYVVLTRTHAPKAIIKKVFDQFHIPYYFTTTTGFFADDCIQAIINWLILLQNPYDELALCTVLTSPYYYVDDTTLAKWKIEKQQESYWDHLVNIQHPIIQDYQHLTQVKQKQNLYELIVELYQMRHFYDYHTKEANKNNLDALYELAIQATQEALTLSEFIEQLKVNQSEDMGDAISLSENADVVRVITVHASKGLEFPVVIYWGTELNRKKPNPIYTDDEFGIAFDAVRLPYRFQKPTLLKKVIARKQQQLSIEEEIRILYVALTRPKQKLVLVDVIHQQKEENQQLSAGYLEQNHAISSIIRTALNSNAFAPLHIQFIDQPWEMTPVRASETSTNDGLERYTMPLIEHQNMNPSSQKAPIITELKLLHHLSNFRGNLLHKTMELLDFKQFQPSDFNQLPFPLSKNDREKVLHFFEHPLFEQLKQMEIYKEYPFIYQSNHTLVQGVMDCVGINDTNILLIDFKSDRNMSKQQLLDHYAPQIQAYYQALHNQYPNHTIHCYLYSFEWNDWLAY